MLGVILSPIFASYIWGYVPEQKDSAADGLQAEVQCKKCGVKKFADLDLRHAGMEKPPEGVTPAPGARCRPCPSGADFTRWTGRTRWKEDRQ